MDSEDPIYSLNCQLAGIYMVLSRAIAMISPVAALRANEDLSALACDPTATSDEKGFYQDLAETNSARATAALLEYAATVH